ncbi:MAG TPA: PAS domain S-box protein, partial [Anaerolineales bacterium]|nr:PAS domain S-box protein [Anaerolineales bacterium]
MPDKDSEITSELADLTERKRHEAELEHLASFPRLNPNPVLELGATGKVIFCNRAAEEVLKSVDCSKSANPFIPKHLQEILQALKQKKAVQFTREIKIGDVFFEENISLVPQLNVVRIYAMDITTRKRAEEKLRASRRQFYSLYFNMAEGVALHDLVYDDRGTTVNYRLVDINPSYEKILHLRRDEVIGRLATEAYGVSAPPYLEEFREVAVKRTPRRLETYFPPMARYFDISIVPWGSSGFATIFTDITDRKQMEAELRESEKLLNKGQEIAHLGSWELDVVCNILTWSDEVYRIFGFQSQAFVATYEAFLEAVHPDDRQAVDSAYSGSLCEGRDTYEIEHRIVRRPTGEIRYVHEKCEHIRDEAGRVIRSVGMVHDITEHKKVEEAQKESYRRYRSLFENMLDGFAYCKMLFDDQGRPDDFVYLDVNSAFSRLTGLDNVVGKKVTKAIPGIKESHPELFEIYGRVALTGRPETFEIEFKPLGLWLFVAVYSMQREYFVAVFDNITERKQAEVVLIKANEELETRVAERTEELEKSRMELEMKNEELHETNHELEMETAERIKALEELREKEQMLIQQGRMAAMGEMLGN